MSNAERPYSEVEKEHEEAMANVAPSVKKLFEHGTVIVENRKFIMKPLKPTAMMKVMKKLTQAVGSGIGGNGGKQIIAAVSEALATISEPDFMRLALLILQNTSTVTVDGAINIDTEDHFDSAFTGLNPESPFVVIFEVLKYNKLPLLRSLGDFDIGSAISGLEQSLKEDATPQPNQGSTESVES